MLIDTSDFVMAAWVKRHRIIIVVLLLLAGGLGLFFHISGSLLVAQDPLPSHADVAVMLDGSVNAVRARRAEAMRLLQQQIVDHVVLSVVKTSYWGESIPEVAERYLERKYGSALTQRVSLCVLDDSVDSTAQEAEVLERCIEDRGWRSIIIVTSNYHTRRARMIWKANLAKANPSFTLSVHAVEDGDFESIGWWRRRRYAKTWFLEATKLTWLLCSDAGLCK